MTKSKLNLILAEYYSQKHVSVWGDFCHAKSSLSAFARDFDSVVSHCARFKTPAMLSDVFTHACYIHINVNMAARVCEPFQAGTHTLTHTESGQQTYARHVSELCAATRNRA